MTSFNDAMGAIMRSTDPGTYADRGTGRTTFMIQDAFGAAMQPAGPAMTIILTSTPREATHQLQIAGGVIERSRTLDKLAKVKHAMAEVVLMPDGPRVRWLAVSNGTDALRGLTVGLPVYIDHEAFVGAGPGTLDAWAAALTRFKVVEPQTPKDSAPDRSDLTAEVATRKHMQRVSALLVETATMLLYRANRHDLSKLEPVEAKPLAEMQRVIDQEGQAPYGSDEYKRRTKMLGPMLTHHYAHNSHHPEHYGDRGVDGMTLHDVVEMFLDWKAASERGEESAMNITAACERYKIEPQLRAILENTADQLGFFRK